MRCAGLVVFVIIDMCVVMLLICVCCCCVVLLLAGLCAVPCSSLSWLVNLLLAFAVFLFVSAFTGRVFHS